MTRPNKIFSETMSYNLTIEKKDYDKLRNFSTKESETYNMQVSVADLIRTSVKLYLDDLEKAYAKRQTEDTDSQRSDGMWIVDAKLSAVRIGLQDKEFVKRGHNIDYRKWITCYVNKTKQACIDWQKDNMARLDKLSQKYSVNVKQYKESVR